MTADRKRPAPRRAPEGAKRPANDPPADNHQSSSPRRVARDQAHSPASGTNAGPAEGARRPARPSRRPRAPKVPSAPSRLAQTAGPEPGTPLPEVRLSVGRIVGAFGVHGELKLDLWTDAPEHLRTVKRIWLDDETTPRELAGIRFQDGRALIRITGITTPEQARELTGSVVRISGEDVKPLEEGEYYLFQLIGLKVVTEDGEEIGTVTDLLETGANDVLVITPSRGGPDVLYPLHPEFVLSIDPTGGTILVRRLEYEN